MAKDVNKIKTDEQKAITYKHKSVCAKAYIIACLWYWQAAFIVNEIWGKKKRFNSNITTS